MARAAVYPSMTLRQSIQRVIRRHGVTRRLAGHALRQASKYNPGDRLPNAVISARGAGGNLPFPPAELIYLVTGNASVSWNLKGGGVMPQCPFTMRWRG
jgi:hypothetical protein